jgi:sterol desaturase/sphingolipid hydroxylase (fatty acid hydroxylase superfamily)
MPTPLELLLDPVSLIIIAIYGALMLWEALLPGRKLPPVKYWKAKGLIAFLLFFYLSSYLPIWINPLLEPYRLVDLSTLNIFWGGLAGVLLYEFGVYVWHYSMHRSNFLWKTFHQMHHSAERLDTYGAFFFSPLDMIGWTVLGSICFSLIAGLSAQAITVMLLTTNFLTIFQHSNVKTPRWLGYIIQRPESHTYHHARGIHKYNYSDLPLFDILFGTFRNPATFDHPTGFYEGASHRLLDMLRARDVSSAPDQESEKEILTGNASGDLSTVDSRQATVD